MTTTVKSLIQDWDNDIKNWIAGYPANHPTITGRMKDFASYVSAGSLSGDYLPEPYYGDPDNCSTVVININPGSSCANENIKNIANLANPGNGRIIYDFVNKFNFIYSDFQKTYSPFVAQKWVPGVVWWQKNRNDYIENIVRLYCTIKRKPLPDKIPSPFAFELCPLHSKNTGHLNFAAKGLLPTYMANIFSPAGDILTGSVIPFGLGFSSLVNKIMIDKKQGTYVVVETWYDGIDSKGKVIDCWPIGLNGKPKKRKYALIKCTSPSLDTKETYFLNTWDNSGHLIYITKKMMSDYEKVDEYIINELIHTFGL